MQSLAAGGAVRQPCSCRSNWTCNPQRLHARRLPRGRLTVVAVGWDPEGILAQPKAGHIQRRMLSKQVADNKELAAEMEKTRQELWEERQRKRQAREVPESDAEVLKYFLATDEEDFEYEVARYRPKLNQEWLAYLSGQIGSERFSATPNEARMAQLEGLRSKLEAAIEKVDTTTAKIAAPADRMKKLLMAKDKKATLLEMAGNNEIDQALLDLLGTNAIAARQAGQEDAAVFMEKVQTAARKFLITV